MTPRKLALIGFAFLILVPIAAGAGPGDRPGGGPGGEGPGNAIREQLPPPGYLKLTDEQKDAVHGLAEDLRAALEPLRDEQRALHEELRENLESDAPNARRVGQLTIALHGFPVQLRAEFEVFDSAFRDLLSDEQLAKYENFRELKRLSRHIDKRSMMRKRFGRHGAGSHPAN